MVQTSLRDEIVWRDDRHWLETHSDLRSSPSDWGKLSKTRLEDSLPNHTCRFRHVGARALRKPGETGIYVPPQETFLRLAGSHVFCAGESCTMISGISNLFELVDLYHVRRDELFSRNVRYFLTSKKNTDKGPAGKMRATLKEMCVESKLAPERFATFHSNCAVTMACP